jgi:hypothetical protein
LVPSGGRRLSMWPRRLSMWPWPCNSKSQPKRFVTFIRPSGGHLFGGCSRPPFNYRKGSCVAHLVVCDHFGDHLQNQYPNWAFLYFQHFWGFVCFSWNQKEKRKKWLAT